MNQLYRVVILAAILLAANILQAQRIVKGKIIDATNGLPVHGATIHCSDQHCKCACTTNEAGEFSMRCTDCRDLEVTFIGYNPYRIVAGQQTLVSLQPALNNLEEVVFTANRGEGTRRADAPVAISTVSNGTIKDAKATTVDQLLNKVSGVNMVNLGNEQHQMSIRQPMTTKSLFLYLEDGIPIRTSGLFNHNALLEMNMAAVKTIEVIKGPSSSLYGSEAIGGVVNFITRAPTTDPQMLLSVQGNNVGYKRGDLSSGFSSGKWGFALSGYYADKRNGTLEYSDFNKGIVTARADYRFSGKTNITNAITYLHYYSDMPGGIDSSMFASKKFSNPQTFTYRKVDAFRYHSTLTQNWSTKSKSTLTAIYRNNIIGQNPAYRIKDDYRKVNGVYRGDKELAHGEINSNEFQSLSLIAQHRQKLNWKKSVLVGGFSADLSPSGYDANYIRIKKDTITKKYVSYQETDSVLSNYRTKLNNYAAFVNFEFNPFERLHIVGSLRYDYFNYNFDNHLAPSSFSGSPDTISSFSRISPKLGFTYNFSNRTGIYANYSEGFVPPQVTELYTGVKVPNLDPSLFYNYEAGGWAEIIRQKLSVDLSMYRMLGTNEIISVKLDDGSYANRNAGKTLHYGIEAAVKATPANSISISVSGAFNKHEFKEYVEKGVSYNGNEMSNAPLWLGNAEIWWKPSLVKGLRIGAELQYLSSYYVDPQNTAKYEGYYALNIRTGYRVKGFDFWLNLVNATNNYYSYITTKSSFGYSYQLAEPVNLNAGVSYDLAQLFKTKK